MYDNGLGVLQDYKEVVQWYRLAAEHHGVAGHLQGAEHQQEAPTAPYLSIPAEEARNHAAQSGSVQRHHLYPCQERLSISGGNHGLGDP